MREIVLDTETTGLDALGGDRIIEIGAVEVVGGIPTGRHLHIYVNPERSVEAGALAVHGISATMLADKPVFAAVADEVARFLDGARLVIHNAAFDIGFLNMELKRCGRPPLTWDRVVDTLALARRRHPAGPNSLDALCARYGIDNSRRTLHGALLDAELLAEVYIELSGGRQAKLGFITGEREGGIGLPRWPRPARQRPVPLAPRGSAAEREAHLAFVATLAEPRLWDRYRVRPEGGLPAGRAVSSAAAAGGAGSPALAAGA